MKKSLLVPLLGLTLALPACKTSQPQVDEAESRKSDVTKNLVSAGDGVYRAPQVECLINQNGIHAKVLVVQPGVRCLAPDKRPPAGEPVKSPLPFFRPYFLFEVYPTTGAAQFYLVGPTMRKKDIIGWLPASAAARWDTRVGARPTRVVGRRPPPITIYATQEALREKLTKGFTSHKPIARSRPGGERTFMPWPIVDVERIEVDGQVYELVKLNFLAEIKEDLSTVDPADVGSPQNQAYGQEALRRVGMLDLVFVIDVTGSMQPYIDQVKATVRAITEDLQKADDDSRVKPNIAFGLVAYRDHDDASTSFVTQHFGLAPDSNTFLERISGLAANNGGDASEALYDGIHAALTATSFRDTAAHKVLVVIADTDGHEPGDRQNPNGYDRNQMIALAREQGRSARIFGLTTNPAETDANRQLLWEQLTTMAEGTRGHCYPLSQASDLVERVKEILASESEEVDNRSKVIRSLIAGASDKKAIASDTGLDIRKVTEVLEFLPGANIDVNKLKPGVPTFHTGWALCEESNLPVLDREVYIPRDDVSMLLAGLNGLVAVSSNPDLARQAHRTGVFGRSSPFAAFFVKQGPETLDIFLQARGIPAGRSSLLRFTANEVQTMSETERARLREKLRDQIIPQLTAASINNDLWRVRGSIPFGWIPEAYLP
jgi:hypothetical protein